MFHSCWGLGAAGAATLSTPWVQHSLAVSPAAGSLAVLYLYRRSCGDIQPHKSARVWEHRQTAGNTQTWAVPARELGPVIHALLSGHTKVRALLQKGRSARKWGPRQRQPGEESGRVGGQRGGRRVAGRP